MSGNTEIISNQEYLEGNSFTFQLKNLFKNHKGNKAEFDHTSIVKSVCRMNLTPSLPPLFKHVLHVKLPKFSV